MKRLLLCVALASMTVGAAVDPLEGLGSGLL